MKIRVYTKTRHIDNLRKFLTSITDAEIIFHTIYSVVEEKDFVTSIFDGEFFDLGISYAYSRKILPPLLTIPKLGFVNFHAAPLPELKGGDPFTIGINNKSIGWGVTAHYMDENYDTGKIIKVNRFNLKNVPKTRHDIGSQAYPKLFELFKEIMPTLISSDNLKRHFN